MTFLKNTSYEAVWIWVEGKAVVAVSEMLQA